MLTCLLVLSSDGITAKQLAMIALVSSAAMDCSSATIYCRSHRLPCMVSTDLMPAVLAIFCLCRLGFGWSDDNYLYGAADQSVVVLYNTLKAAGGCSTDSQADVTCLTIWQPVFCCVLFAIMHVCAIRQPNQSVNTPHW